MNKYVFLLLFICSCGVKQPVENQNTNSVADTIQRIQSIQQHASFHIARDGRFLDTLVTGNFDHDAKIDTAFLWVPMDPDKEFKMFGCNPCNSEISFSNHLPPLIHDSDIGGILENAGDLDGDGMDELAYDGGWFMGCWGVLELYKIKDKTWQEAGSIEYYACSETPIHLTTHIKKLGNGKVKLLGDHPVYSEDTEVIYDLKADSLPCKTWEKKFDE